MTKTSLSSVFPDNRNTGQFLLPLMKPSVDKGDYDIYPSFRLCDNRIYTGFESLTEIIFKCKYVIIDGYSGVFFDQFQSQIDYFLKGKGKKISWVNTLDFLKRPEEVEKMVSPFTGGNDPLFGTRTSLDLKDFYNLKELKNQIPDSSADINIIIGHGASLAGWNGFLIYLDLPKNEIQFRARAGSITNLGLKLPFDPAEMYKRFYFIDWVVLNKHKKKLLHDIDIIVDTQRPDNPVWMDGDLLRQSLNIMAHNFIRARPWFEPGVWGGTWIKNHISGLNKDVPNYAWSFELISPENGILFESSGILLEASFDLLMFQESKAVLGDCHDHFGNSFPLRFDFLDTFDGGNLSVQCHPRPEYMKLNFGEDYTQEESYYILDSGKDASVYLGFREDIKPDEFRAELERSKTESQPVDIEKFVLKFKSSKHDLFLIPYGTVHGSGMNNLVLEISTTPYIFTFKMYDWLRLDLNGKPRQLNISRAMDNLYFERSGSEVQEKLISKPILIDEGDGWKLYHLATHQTQLYDVHRVHFRHRVEIKTGNKCHVLSLVEGSGIRVETRQGFSARISYAETFVIPAASGSYTLINESGTEAIVVKAFIK